MNTTAASPSPTRAGRISRRTASAAVSTANTTPNTISGVVKSSWSGQGRPRGLWM